MKNNQIIFTLREADIELQLNSLVFPPEGIESITYEENRAIVTLTHDITEVEGYAVNNIYDVESVALPESIERISAVAFADLHLVVRFEGPLASADGLLLVKEGTLLAYADSFAKEITLPDTFVAIADSVFRSCSDLEKITLPAHLEHIGAHAFDTCTYLREVVWPDTLLTIGSLAFVRCALQRVDLPDSVISIGDVAFGECTQIEHVHIGASVSHIGEQVFGGCKALKGFSGQYATTDGHLLIQNHTVVSAVAQAEHIHIPEGVERIAPYAFYQTIVTEKVQLPSTLKEICDNGFSYCDVDVALPEGLETIGYYAFYSNIGLKHVHLPETVRQIGDGAFGDNNVQQFSGRYATHDGTYLIQDGRLLGVAERDWECYEIPQGVTYIGSFVFHYLNIKARLIVPEGVTTIARGAFHGEENTIWTSISLPSTLRTIDDYAFSHLHLQSALVLPEGLEHIGKNAFEYANLGEPLVILPSTLLTLGDYAFSKANYLQEEKPIFEFRGKTPPAITSRCVFTNYQAIRIPQEGREQYAEAHIWKDLKKITVTE